MIILVLAFIANFAQSQNGTQSRSAKSGKYVTKDYAKKHKATTYTTKGNNKGKRNPK